MPIGMDIEVYGQITKRRKPYPMKDNTMGSVAPGKLWIVPSIWIE